MVEEEEDEEEGPRVISGTELERFMLPRVTFLCVVFPSRRPQCGWFFSYGKSCVCKFTHTAFAPTFAYEDGKPISCGGSVQKATMAPRVLQRQCSL